jgi:hypothetical protein
VPTESPDTFEILPEHIALLQAMNWRWGDSLGFGGPAVDWKPSGGYVTSAIVAGRDRRVTG